MAIATLSLPQAGENILGGKTTGNSSQGLRYGVNRAVEALISLGFS